MPIHPSTKRSSLHYQEKRIFSRKGEQINIYSEKIFSRKGKQIDIYLEKIFSMIDISLKSSPVNEH